MRVRRNSPSAARRRWLSLTASRPSGSPALNRSSRSIVSVRVRRLPTISTWPTKIRWPSPHRVNDSGLATVGAEARARIDRGALDTRGWRTEAASASRSIGNLRLKEGGAGAQAQMRAQRGFRHRLVLPSNPHRRDDRAHAFANRDAHEQLHLPAAGGPLLRFQRRVGLRGGESAPAIQRLDAGEVGVETGRGERLAVAHAQSRTEIGQRHRRVAGDLDPRHAVLRAFLHGEGDQQLAVRLRAHVRRRRVAISLGAKVLLDPVARVLQQIFVDRPFALDRHELVVRVGRQRIPGKDDAHVRPRRDGQRDVRDPIVVRAARRWARPRLRKYPFVRRLAM